MKFIHRIGFRANEDQRRKLESLGIGVPDGLRLSGDGDPLVTFDLSEDHQNWSNAQALLKEWGVVDMLRTEFSREEINGANRLNLLPDWHYGYPQPNELEFGYLEAAYDLADYCDKCGVGARQINPFQMKGEPKWGKRSILQLNWVFDEYFVTPEVWSAMFKPYGVDCRPVLNTKGAELKTVVQLSAAEEVPIEMENLVVEREACLKCGRLKYAPLARGFFPALMDEPKSEMVKTREYFGSGASAYREVVVSKNIARALLDNKVRGASLRPVAARIG